MTPIAALLANDTFDLHGCQRDLRREAQREARLTWENARLNTLVGALPLERKNTDEVSG